MPFKPATFRPAHAPAPGAASRDYDARRGSARERGYSTAWDRAAAAFKATHPLCVGCQAMGRVVPATVVDHVIPHRGSETLFWAEENLQPSCAWHHDMVKQHLERMYDQRLIGDADLSLDSDAAVELSRRLEGAA
jgi:5-methylcytosine-specific restriction protein A